MNQKLLHLINSSLCEMVKRETGLKIIYNKKTQSIFINNKGPFKLTFNKRKDLIQLIGI